MNYKQVVAYAIFTKHSLRFRLFMTTYELLFLKNSLAAPLTIVILQTSLIACSVIHHNTLISFDTCSNEPTLLLHS